MKKYIILVIISWLWVFKSYAQTPQKITYTYDDLSRLSQVSYPNGTSIIYTYDVLGNRQTQVISSSICTPPNAPTVSSVTINSGQTATLSATNCAGTVNWFSASSGGASIATGASYTTQALTTSTTYYASCTVNNCESTTRGSGSVTVNGGCTPPNTPTVSSVTINTGQTATLSATNCTGTVNWFSASTGGASIATGASYTSPPLTANTTFYASCTVSGCESATRGSGLVTVNATCTSMYSLKTGQWNDVTVWSCGRVPTSTDIITVKASHFITIPASYTANAKNVIFETGSKIVEAANTSKLCLSCPNCPTITFTVTPTATTCNVANGSAIISGITGGTTPFTYKWDNGTFGSNTTQGSLASGSHTIIIKDANGCTATQTFTIGSSTAISPTTNFTFANTTGNSYSFTNTSINAVSHNWNFGNSTTSTAINPSVAFANNNLFNVCLTATSSCNLTNTICKSVGGATPTTNGLMLYLPFSGNTNDLSGNGNNGTNNGATLTTDRYGVANKAYYFGGINNPSNIQVNNSPTLQFTNEITISLWYLLSDYAGMNGIQQNVAYGTHTLFAKDFDNTGFYGRVFGDQAANSMKLDFVGVPGPTNFMIFPNFGDLALNLNNWIHLVYVLGNGHLKVFKNGVLNQDRVLTSMPDFTTANTKNLFFGRYGGGYWYPLNGKLDDIRFYNRALTDVEVQSIYTIEK
jgi:Ig-like domain CHU_C associated/Concanavalin A-like lectin/glucanases superfamily/RHS Repeat